ncbi:uncharacterized protein LOC143030260 [Oratosquilla oratoria]|uniref:uncharacterized protein LOC143030260 n=1 Tax=Oratosquilla oratoria TaxID=337810 RepID=UPI003F76F2B3
MTTKFGKKRSSLDHTYATIESSQEVNNMDMTLPQSRNNENCEGSSMGETSTQGVGEVKGWTEIAENLNDSVNNAGSRAKRLKVSGKTEDQAKSATTKDPLMTAIEAAGMDQDLIIEENNTADTKAADVNQDNIVGDITTSTGKERLMITFPEKCNLSLENKYTWYMALLKQHPDCRPLFKEGRNAPYITLINGQQYNTMITDGFQGQVMKPITGLQRTVVIFDVPINVNLLQCPPGFQWLKRRMVGKNPRPQLLGAVSGPIDTETHIIGVGRKRVAPYVPEPDLCQKCSKWGHKSCRCRTTYVRCRYCAGGHLSEECWEKIQQKVAVPPKCCNCGGQHNASSPVCPKKPRYKTLPPSIPSIPTTVYQTAPPPTRTAWNVTAMQEEFPPLQQEKATTNSTTKSPDFIAVQETGPEVYELRGYYQHILSCDDGSSRGMVTYVKSGLPVTLVEKGVNGGIEYITVCLHLSNNYIYITNMYVHSGALYIDNLPPHILEESTILLGDLNARHVDLGSFKTSNTNGVRWVTFLKANDNVQITGAKVPTHVQGGRLDYVALFNMPFCTCETNVVSSLLSDHFVLKTYIPLSTTNIVHRKRLSIPSSKFPGLLINDTIAALQSRWQAQPNDHDVKRAMGTVAKHLSELKRDMRKKYWDEFLNKIRNTKSIQEVWYHVNKIKGKKTSVTSDSNPAKKVKDLIKQWSSASALSGLPVGHKMALAENRLQRLQLVNHNVKLDDDTCVPISIDELLYAVKSGKSTAPGEDGLTYNIINALLNIDGKNPILDMFNVSYRNSTLPPAWKSAIIIPVPKSDGKFRPISLTSCLCKMMERIVLRRLIYKVGDKMSENLYGFMKGRATSDCFVHCLANTNASCQVYVDLKGAFDRANKEVILEELGTLSEEETFELGTPQGGVPSPMLYNILMDKIARYEFTQGTKVIIYADDILIQCDTPKTLSKAVNELEQLYLDINITGRCTGKLNLSPALYVQGREDIHYNIMFSIAQKSMNLDHRYNGTSMSSYAIT